MSGDLISRQAVIEELNVGAELLRRVLDDTDIVGAERSKYEWGLELIESYIFDMKDLPSAQPEPPLAPQWIPCSERLPKKPDGYPHCGIYRTYFLVSLESGCVKTLAYEFERDEWQITGSPVKAWMPLPEPYKETT